MPSRFHTLQITIAGALCFTSILIYTFAPENRTDLARDLAFLSSAFLFGKFSNGYPRSKPTRWDDDRRAKHDANKGEEDE